MWASNDEIGLYVSEDGMLLRFTKITLSALDLKPNMKGPGEMPVVQTG